MKIAHLKIHNRTLIVLKNLYFLYLALLPSLTIYTFRLAYPNGGFNLDPKWYILPAIGAFVAIFFYFACFSIFSFPHNLWRAVQTMFVPLIPIGINVALGQGGISQLAEFFTVSFFVITIAFYVMLFTKFKSESPDTFSVGLISITFFAFLFMLAPLIALNTPWWGLLLITSSIVGQTFFFTRGYAEIGTDPHPVNVVVMIIIGALSIFLIPIILAFF